MKKSSVMAFMSTMERWAVRLSGKFDEKYYLHRYPDVARADFDPLKHFCTHGWREGRDPGPLFDNRYYSSSKMKDCKNIINPVIHWVFHGCRKSKGNIPPEVYRFRKMIQQKRLCSMKQGDIIFIVHDCSLTGAPVFILNLLKWILDKTSIEFSVVILSSGPLLQEFCHISECIFYWALSDESERKQFQNLLSGAKTLYVNSIASGSVLPEIAASARQVITHVHEMEGAFEAYPDELSNVLAFSTTYVVVSELGKEALERRLDDARQHPRQIAIIRPAVPIKPLLEHENTGSSFLIVGCGKVSARKGVDIFCQVARALVEDGVTEFKMRWIGGSGDVDILSLIKEMGLADFVEWFDEAGSPRSHFDQADIFILTSREDPFPLVCLEAAECATPIVCFGPPAGDVFRFVEQGCGIVVPYLDVPAMKDAVKYLLENKKQAQEMGKIGRDRVIAQHSFDTIGPEIISHICPLHAS